MNSTVLPCLLLLTLGGWAWASKQCEDDSWYDALTGLCRRCDVCGKKSLELEPCAQFKNTICVDLSLFKFDLKPKHQKWHEMETMDSERVQVELKDATPDKKVSSAPAKVGWYSVWDIGVFVVLCCALLSVVLAAVVLLFRQPGRFFSWNGSGKGSRFRLFSRDRLSTTEYMNNLATLDRRLAMDEILEKRKKAIFDSQLLPENVYCDEVFVDISGLPHHIYEDLRIGDFGDQGPTNSLLRPDRQPNA